MEILIIVALSIALIVTIVSNRIQNNRLDREFANVAHKQSQADYMKGWDDGYKSASLAGGVIINLPGTPLTEKE